jgi:mRNA interferase RelE/StbE
MPYTVIFSSRAKRLFRKLPRDVQETISQYVALLEESPRGHYSKKLKGADAYRMRIWDYRVIYEIKDDVLLVLVINIAHRREAYKKHQ